MTAISVSGASPIGSGACICPPCDPGDLLVAAVMGDFIADGCPGAGGQTMPFGWQREKNQNGHLAFYSKIASSADPGTTFVWTGHRKMVFRAEIFVIPSSAQVVDWCPDQTSYVRFCCSPAGKGTLCRTGCQPGQDDLGVLPSWAGVAPADGMGLAVLASHPQGFPIVAPDWFERESIQISPTPENPAWTVATRQFLAGESIQVIGEPASANYQHGMAGILFAS